MLIRKYGTDRHRPFGRWVQVVSTNVVGGCYRKDNVDAFCNAVDIAEHKGLKYTVGMVPEPDNPHDPNAIKVYGLATTQSFLEGKKPNKWHIGYLSSGTSLWLYENLLSKQIPLAMELYGIYEDKNDNTESEYYGKVFTDIKCIVLAPPGFSASSIKRRNKV